MLEQMRPNRETHGAGPGGLDDIFAGGNGSGLATVSHAPYAEQLPVGNMSVAEVRSRYRDRFDIDPHSQAILDGAEVGDDTIVRAGQTLMFVRRAGEKGIARALSMLGIG